MYVTFLFLLSIDSCTTVLIQVGRSNGISISTTLTFCFPVVRAEISHGLVEIPYDAVLCKNKSNTVPICETFSLGSLPSDSINPLEATLICSRPMTLRK